ncbi:MAG: hypothetical protein ACXVI5_06000 [Halobacteriota archaeon]
MVIEAIVGLPSVVMTTAVIANLPAWWSAIGWAGNVLSGIMGAGQLINFFLSLFGLGV